MNPRALYGQPSADHAWGTLVELCLLTLAFVAAVAVWTSSVGEPLTSFPNLWLRALAAALVLMGTLHYGDLFEEPALAGRADLVLRVLQAFLGGALLLALVFVVAPDLRVGRVVFTIYLVLAFATIAGWRVLSRVAWGHDALAERILIVGTGQSAKDIARQFLKRKAAGYEVVGFLGEADEVGRVLVNPAVVGTVDEIEALAVRHRVGLVVVALDEGRGRMPVEDLLRLRTSGVRVADVTTTLERLTGRISLKSLRPSWLVFSEGFDRSHVFQLLKRGVDLFAATFLLILTAPLFAVLAALIRLDSRGPVLYRQERLGERGRPFTLLKLRTMREDAEAEGPAWTSEGEDPRATRLGRLLRKARLDELPQLWNVFRGEMSFVGPRPERPFFVEQLRKVIPFYDERHSVKPGITGWAQVKFHYGSSLEDAEEKLEYDLYYIKHMSWAFDIGILFYTAKVLLLGRGAR
jgi:sugar transferase (PEP-CTERM system associated)